jgi:hypothetical protein
MCVVLVDSIIFHFHDDFAISCVRLLVSYGSTPCVVFGVLCYTGSNIGKWHRAEK